MKKDIFNGKIRREHISYIESSLIFFSLLCLVGAVGFSCVALLAKNLEPVDLIVLFSTAGVCLLVAIIYPIISVCLIRIYPKHRKITRLLIKEFVFKDYEKYNKY